MTLGELHYLKQPFRWSTHYPTCHPPPLPSILVNGRLNESFSVCTPIDLDLNLIFRTTKEKVDHEKRGVDKRTGVRRATAWNVAESRVAREEEKKSFELAQGNDGFVDLSKYRELG